MRKENKIFKKIYKGDNNNLQNNYLIKYNKFNF